MANSYSKPGKFDRNLVVLGAGSAGLVSAYIAAALKASVSLIEKHRMGGDCLNTGCVPSKALIRSARILAQSKRAAELGFKRIDVEFDFAELMERVQRIIATIEPHDSVERYTELGVDCISGEARINSPWSVQVGQQTLSTRNIIVATGAHPFVPPVPGIENVTCYTSDTLWNLRELPGRLVVLGGGPIGCELSQCFARLGSKVTQVEMLPRVLIREDGEVSELVQQSLSNDGVQLLLEHRATQFKSHEGKQILVCEHNNKQSEIEFDAVLVAVGRRANTSGFGLEELGVELNDNGTIKTNSRLQTNYESIFACGDVAGPYQFTHAAAHQAWYAAVNALFRPLKTFKVDYSVIPWATFTEPEVARVGLNEIEARESNIDYEVSCYPIDDLDRAIADSEAHGFVKVLTKPGKDTILGATIVGEHAGELITEYISAMRHGYGMNKILGTIHIYPTLSEANKYAAGVWKRAHAPELLLKLVQRFHRFRL